MGFDWSLGISNLRTCEDSTALLALQSQVQLLPGARDGFIGSAGRRGGQRVRGLTPLFASGWAGKKGLLLTLWVPLETQPTKKGALVAFIGVLFGCLGYPQLGALLPLFLGEDSLLK